MLVLGATLKTLGWRDDDGRRAFSGMRRGSRSMRCFRQSAGMIIAVQMLHGICYAFFFATVYIFVDAHSPKDIRASAQGLFNLQILGIGALLANSICPWLLQSVYTTGGVTDFRGLFMVPLAAASIAAIALALFFRPPTPDRRTAVRRHRAARAASRDEPSPRPRRRLRAHGLVPCARVPPAVRGLRDRRPRVSRRGVAAAAQRGARRPVSRVQRLRRRAGRDAAGRRLHQHLHRDARRVRDRRARGRRARLSRKAGRRHASPTPSASIATARRTKRALVVGYILQVHPSWQRFTEIARTLGTPLVMRMNLNQQSSGAAWATHKNLLRSTSPIVDCGVHYVDVMCRMTGSRPVQRQRHRRAARRATSRPARSTTATCR